MTTSVKSLLRCPVHARDGAAGWLTDLYFHDRDWRLRYFVVDPGRPMPRRERLVPAAAVAGADEALRLALTREEIERCLDLDEDKPVFLQHDMAAVSARGDPHLRSCRFLLDCAVRGAHGPVRRVKDLLLDDAGRAISAIVVDTAAWLPGRRLEIDPREVEAIHWVEHEITLRPPASGQNLIEQSLSGS